MNHDRASNKSLIKGTGSSSSLTTTEHVIGIPKNRNEARMKKKAIKTRTKQAKQIR